MSPADAGLRTGPADRRLDAVSRNAGAAPDGDDKILEIVELICHNVAAGKVLDHLVTIINDS